MASHESACPWLMNLADIHLLSVPLCTVYGVNLQYQTAYDSSIEAVSSLDYRGSSFTVTKIWKKVTTVEHDVVLSRFI
jgi:hypothetical protein